MEEASVFQGGLPSVKFHPFSECHPHTDSCHPHHSQTLTSVNESTATVWDLQSVEDISTNHQLMYKCIENLKTFENG